MKKELTKTSSISSKYQTVIPREIRQAANLHVHGELIWQILQKGDMPIIVVSPKPKKWGDYIVGLGKEVWKDTTTDKYLHNLRKEWQT